MRVLSFYMMTFGKDLSLSYTIRIMESMSNPRISFHFDLYFSIKGLMLKPYSLQKIDACNTSIETKEK